MRFKIEETRDANIFIYGKMTPEETNLILFSKAECLNSQSASQISQVRENGRLWLIRESRVEGLLTVQSISWKKDVGRWRQDMPQRYMLSNFKGWVVNNANPESAEFSFVADSVGGIIKMTDENTQPHLPGLLKILSENGYHVNNRVNPQIGQETRLKGYTTYRTNATIPQQEYPGSKLESTRVNFPEGILIACSCLLTAVKTGQIKVMKDPVTLVQDGISYERSTLLEKYPNLEEGKHFYPNVRLKTIINYLSATSLSPDEYWEKLQKVEEDIKDPILLTVMEEPLLSPSGHSYEKSSIEKWIKSQQGDLPTLSNTTPIPDPMTGENIRGKTLAHNLNLKKFIKAWPDFYLDLEYQRAINSSSKTPLM